MPDLKGVTRDPAVPCPWFWWGVRWTMPDERNKIERANPFVASFTDPEFQQNQEALLSAIHARKAAWKALFSIGKAALQLVPSAGTVSELVQTTEDIWAAVGIWQDHAGHTDKAEKLAKAEEDTIKQILAPFALLLDGKKGDGKPLPVVLLLDDAQWMDSLSLRIVRQFWATAKKRRWPLLVLATHWQKEWNERFLPETASDPALAETFAAWCASESVSPQPAGGEGFFSVWKLGKLPEIGEILKTAFPGLTEEQVGFFVEKASGNPRHISEIVFLLEDRKESFENDDFSQPLSDYGFEEMKSESLDLVNLFKKRFASISEPVKQLLGSASIQGDQFLSQFAVEVAEKLAFTPADLPTLSEAEKPHALTESIDEYSQVVEFRDRTIRTIAEDFLKRKKKGKTEEWHRAVVAVANEWVRSGKLDELSSEQSISLLETALRCAESVADRPAQVVFVMVALEQIEISGFYRGMDAWVSRWEAINPTKEDLSTYDFLDLVKILGFFRSAGSSSIAEGLLETLGGHPALEGDDEDSQRCKARYFTERAFMLNQSGKTNEALDLYLCGFEIRKDLLVKFGETSERLLEISVSLSRIGGIEEELGKTESALLRFEQSLQIHQELLAKFGESPERLGNISSSLVDIGDVEIKLGKTESALEQFERSFQIRKELLAKFGESPERLRAISVSLDRIGNVELELWRTGSALGCFERCLQISEELLAKFGESPERLRGISVSLAQVGDVELQLGNTESALERFDRCLQINEELLAKFDETPERLQNIAVSLDRIGDVEQELGKTESAIERFERSLQIREEILAKYDDTPERLRDISVWLQRIGDAELQLGKTESALQRFERSLQIKEGLLGIYGETFDLLTEIVVALCSLGEATLGVQEKRTYFERARENLNKLIKINTLADTNSEEQKKTLEGCLQEVEELLRSLPAS